MEIAKKKRLLQKILISVITFFLLFNLIFPIIAFAKGDEDTDIGGGLFTPVQGLLMFVGDSLMRLMQIAFTGNNHVTVKITSTNVGEAEHWNIPTKEDGTEFDWGNDVKWNSFTDESVDVPTIEISPESIFSGKIPAFDINFFNPMEEVKYSNGHYTDVKEKVTYAYKFQNGQLITNGTYSYNDANGVRHDTNVQFSLKTPNEILLEHGWVVSDDKKDTPLYAVGDNEWTHSNQLGSTGSGYVKIFQWYEYDSNKDTKVEYKLSYKRTVPSNYTREDIIEAVLFEKGQEWEVTSEGYKKSTAGALQSTVSYWYNLLRNIATIGLLSVLVYIGIRIVLSSTASDKSKYKAILMDWLVALCLLFFMHYFMNFVVSITGMIAKAIDSNGMLTVQDNGITVDVQEEETTGVRYLGDELIGNVRIKLQTGDVLQHMAYTIIYIVLIIYTFVFAFMYMKRVLYMAFFTMMAPLVALTYPLDKIKDKKAQAFEMWIKEYIFNALIQPFHLALYYILVSTSISLAKDNIIYSLVAIGFMIPAEKILRKFFGMESETAGALGGVLSGMLAMKGIDYLKKAASGKKSKKDGSNSKDGNDKNKIRMAKAPGHDRNSLIDGASREGRNNNNNSVRQANQNRTTAFDNVNTNPSNAIPQGQAGYVPGRDAAQERLDELRAEGFGPGDSEYDNALNELNSYTTPLDQWDALYAGMGEETLSESLANNSSLNTDVLSDEINSNSNDLRLIDSFDDDISSNADSEPEITNNDHHKINGFVGTSLRYAGKGALAGLKLGAKATGAATLGTIGIAAGLASDDYSNVLKWGAAGAGAGSMLTEAAGKKIYNTASDVKQTALNVRDEYERNMYTTEELKEIQRKRAQEQFMKDKEAQKKFKEEFKDYKAAMEAAKEYRNYGITDNEAIIKAMKLKTKGLSSKLDDKRRILIAATASQLGRKDIDSYGERLEKRGFDKKGSEIMKRAARDFNGYE